jgi:hypothetical protein
MIFLFRGSQLFNYQLFLSHPLKIDLFQHPLFRNECRARVRFFPHIKKCNYDIKSNNNFTKLILLY